MQTTTTVCATAGDDGDRILPLPRACEPGKVLKYLDRCRCTGAQTVLSYCRGRAQIYDDPLRQETTLTLRFPRKIREPSPTAMPSLHCFPPTPAPPRSKATSLKGKVRPWLPRSHGIA